MTAMNRFHQQLLEPSAYPETTKAVAFKETHISRIYLTDRHAYKLKKPLNLGFLDFSTLQKRHHYCNEEVRLNRRFANDTYLGVVTLRQQQEKIVFGSRGKLLDYAVKMRRLPEERMLNRLIETGAPALLHAMPQLYTALHRIMAVAETCHNESVRNVEVVKHNCEDNFSQTVSAIGITLTAEAHALMHKATQNDLKVLEGVILERETKGFVREGHGDLHTANICMTDPICVFDCIEFNRHFRVADIVADLAFLIMDLEFRDRRDLADTLTIHYQESSGDQDFAQLLPFYKQYRAWVRGKVETILTIDSQASTESREKAKKRAYRYFNLALGYRIKPTLFLFSGLMGVGKTTLARGLAQATGAIHLRSDIIRKQLAGVSEEQHCLDDFNTGVYSHELTEQTYKAIFRSAEEAFSRQNSVVIDASFASNDERERFMRLASQAGYPAWLLALECPDDVALERLDRRTGDASDGRRELYSRQKANFNNIAVANHVVTVDTTRPVDYNVQSLLCRVLTGQEPLT